MEDVSTAGRARSYIARGKNSSNLDFWLPRFGNKTPDVSTPVADSFSDLTGQRDYLDTFMANAAADMIKSVAILICLSVE